MAVPHSGVVAAAQAVRRAVGAILVLLVCGAIPAAAQDTTPTNPVPASPIPATPVTPAVPAADTAAPAPTLPATTPTESHVVGTVGSSAGADLVNVNSPTLAAGSAATPNKPGVPPTAPPRTINGVKGPAGTTKTLDVEHADSSTLEGDVGTLIGHVKLIYEGYLITCDRASYNQKTGVIRFENNVIITEGDQVVYADSISLDRFSNTFSSSEARTILAPQYVGGGLLQPLRVSGKTIAREGNNIVLTDGLMTTCDFPAPHYKIGFRKATIIPNNRIVLRKAVLYRYERAIFRIDYLALPIRDDLHYSYLPVVGYTQLEGYFIKNAIGYVLKKDYPGILRVDYMTRKGLGLGFDQAYRFSEFAAGTLVLYTLYDRSTGGSELTYHLNHQQRIGDTVTGILSDYQHDNYEAQSQLSTTQGTTINTVRNVLKSNTSANLVLSNSSQPVGGFYTTSSETHSANYTLTETERLNQTGNVTVRFTGGESRTVNTTPATTTADATSLTTGSDSKRVDISATTRSGIFDVTLAANKILQSTSVGSTGNGSSNLGPEKLPDLTLTTNSDRLKGLLFPTFFSAIPVNVTFGYGRQADNATMIVNTTKEDGTNSTASETHRILSSRSLFDAAINPRTIPLTPGGALSLQTNGDFRQLFYGSDYAEYVLTQNTALTQKLGANSSFDLKYNYERPYGATPTEFRADQSISTNVIATDLNVIGKRVKFGAGTAFNIVAQQNRDIPTTQKRNPWQLLTNYVALNPSSIIQTRFDSQYDINTLQVVGFTNATRIRGKGSFSFDTHTIYDTIQRRVRDITGSVQTTVFSRDLQLTYLTDYNPEQHTYGYKNLGLIRSFHDYEYVFSYHEQPLGYQLSGKINTDRGFNFAIRLKAFPISTSQPTSQYGAAVNVGNSEVF